MKIDNLENMIGGWFVGAFKPSVFNTDSCEVALKRYAKGDNEKAHYHKISTEITLVVEGEVLMSGKVYKKGDIIVLKPGEITDFNALTDAVNVVVKIPGTLNDKYIV
ncbi:hypothetical protein L2088_24990 [Pseudomonas protegens]|uniref:hypothetical protein n=1 Tax=Pseudomonas protegens TaxID=380021 RepID=UPI0020255029|nr:hypothetical protein [Pseudomonas protegens]MCL9657974.1 hypothetical protein [Pseudomonas protegens]